MNSEETPKLFNKESDEIKELKEAYIRHKIHLIRLKKAVESGGGVVEVVINGVKSFVSIGDPGLESLLKQIEGRVDAQKAIYVRKILRIYETALIRDLDIEANRRVREGSGPYTPPE